MNKSNKILSLALLFALVVFPMSACGNSNDEQPQDTVKEEQKEEDKKEENKQEEQKEEDKKEDKQETTSDKSTLNLSLSTTDGSSKDTQIPAPWLNRTLPTNLMFRSLFLADSTLTSVTPDLAEKYEVSDDGITYTITLKEGLKWSDGESLTPEDVKFSIETALQSTVINSIYTGAFSNIKEMVVDNNVLTITLEQPSASLINILGQFAILPKHSLEGADPLTIESNEFWTKPVTSGMFMVDELNVGNYFTMVLNPHYEGTEPKIKNITVNYVSDYLTAAQSKTSDYIYGNSADMIESLNEASGFTSHEIDVLFYKYFIFNMKGVDGKENEAMQNVDIRKAIMSAIDRATLANFYPNANVLSSGVPNDYNAYNGFSYEYNADEAKKLLQSSGYDINRPLRICYYNNDQTSIDLINTIVFYLEEIGFKVEATLSNDGTTDLFTTRDYDIGFKGKSSFSVDEWYGEYMSDEALFKNIFGGDTAFDELVKNLYSATDEAKRDEALKNLQALEQEKIYKVPLFTVGNFAFTSDRISLPSGTEFCNPLYNCDINFENWELK